MLLLPLLYGQGRGWMDQGCSLIARRSWVALSCSEVAASSNVYRSVGASKCLGNSYFIFLLYRAVIAMVLEWFEPHGFQRSSSVGSNGRSLMANLYFPIFPCLLGSLVLFRGLILLPRMVQPSLREAGWRRWQCHLPGCTFFLKCLYCIARFPSEGCWACCGTSL